MELASKVLRFIGRRFRLDADLPRVRKISARDDGRAPEDVRDVRKRHNGSESDRTRSG